MLQKLQEARQTAQTISARSGKKLFFYHPAMFFLLLKSEVAIASLFRQIQQPDIF